MTLFSKKYQHNAKPIIGNRMTFQACCALKRTAANVILATNERSQPTQHYPNPLDLRRTPRLMLLRY